MISKSIALIFRLAQLLCAAAIMGLVGHMLSTSYWNQIPRTSGNAAEVNFTMFLSVFTLLSLLFLAPASWKYFTDQNVFKIASAVDAINMIFYMCDGIALAAALEVHSCDNPIYTEGNRITQTSPNTKVRCREAQAATAFVWVLFVLFVVTTAFSLSMCIDDFDIPLPESFGRVGRRVTGRGERDGEDEERPRPDMEEVSGGPMVADETPEPARAYGRFEHRAGSLNGGHWNADTDDEIRHVHEIGGGFGSGGNRVINVPAGGPEFAEDDGHRMR